MHLRRRGMISTESVILKLEGEYPLVDTMKKMDELFSMIDNLFTRFEILTGHILKQLNEDDYDFKSNIDIIQQRINIVKIWYENNLKNAVPVEMSPKNVISAIDFFCTTLDTHVFNSNSQIFEIVKTGHWIDADGKKFKNLYVELIELVKMFYNRCITLNQEQHKLLIRKTKNVMGVVLNDKAASPDASLTEKRMHEWLTQEQFNLSMKPEELKPTT